MKELEIDPVCHAIAAQSPPNPFYTCGFQVSLSIGLASMLVSCPNGKITKDDYEHVAAATELFLKQLERRQEAPNAAIRAAKPEEDA